MVPGEMKRALVDEVSLPPNWTRNRGLEVRLVRPLCLEHQSLAAFVDIAPPQCTEGVYDTPSNAIALVKGYRPHAQFTGFECCIQRPVFCIADANQVVAEVSGVVESQMLSESDWSEGD